MQFESWTAFVAMGGYGLYVWLSVAACIGTMGILIVTARRQSQVLKRRILRQHTHLQPGNQQKASVQAPPPVPKAGRGHLRISEPRS